MTAKGIAHIAQHDVANDDWADSRDIDPPSSCLLFYIIKSVTRFFIDLLSIYSDEKYMDIILARNYTRQVSTFNFGQFVYSFWAIVQKHHVGTR